MSAAAAINRFLGASPMAQTPDHIPEVGKMVSAPERSALVEIMAEAAYDWDRHPNGQREPWRGRISGTEYAERFRVAIQAALAAAEAAGYTITKGKS